MSTVDLSNINLFSEEDLVEKFSKVYTTGSITVEEYNQLAIAIASSQLEEEVDLWDRLRHAIKRGWVKTIPQQP